jgi:hypothetical protein
MEQELNEAESFTLGVVASLVEARALVDWAKANRGVDAWAYRVAFRLARNRLAAIRRGEPEPLSWYVEKP